MLFAVHDQCYWVFTMEVITHFRRIMLGEHIGDIALTPLSVNHILKNRARIVNIPDSKLLSAHSLRRGLATSAARAGAPLQTIMRAGRWKQTNTVMGVCFVTSYFSLISLFSKF